MTEKERIAELEAKLETLQKDEANGQDPELLAKAKQMAKMSWYDIMFVLEVTGLGELGKEDVSDLQAKLVQRKYDNLAGHNKSGLAWNN